MEQLMRGAPLLSTIIILCSAHFWCYITMNHKVQNILTKTSYLLLYPEIVLAICMEFLNEEGRTNAVKNWLLTKLERRSFMRLQLIYEVLVIIKRPIKRGMLWWVLQERCLPRSMCNSSLWIDAANVDRLLFFNVSSLLHSWSILAIAFRRWSKAKCESKLFHMQEAIA